MKRFDRCRSRLLLARKYDRCMWQKGHGGWHRWWSGDARVHVEWAQGEGGARWRRPLPSGGHAKDCEADVWWQQCDCAKPLPSGGER